MTKKIKPKQHDKIILQNRFQILWEEDTIDINEVQTCLPTRLSGMNLHVANVSKPLASAVKVAQAGKRIVMDPEEGKSYIENVNTKEKMAIRPHKGTFVIDAQFTDGTMGLITLDSGVGVSVWPKSRPTPSKMLSKEPGLKMMAANGTMIENIGRKIIKFRGRSFFTRQS